jgi:Tol biopolymer transport system component
MTTRRVLSLVACLVVGSTPLLAQAAPELVQLGVISTDRNETFPAIDPADGSLWFSVYTENFDRQVIMRAARGGSGWERPAVVAFSGGDWGDRAPRFSPDGKRLYFSSNRPRAVGAAGGAFHLWVLDRTGREWSEPRLLPAPINSSAADRHSSETRAGDLYFSSTRPGGAGRSDIYRARRAGSAWSAERLPAPINDQLSQPDLLVAPDGRWMLLVITDHPDGLGGDDLFLSRFQGGSWSAPRRLPEPINSKEYEYGPSLSPDGRILYFTSHRRGSADVYRVSVTALGLDSR